MLQIFFRSKNRSTFIVIKKSGRISASVSTSIFKIGSNFLILVAFTRVSHDGKEFDLVNFSSLLVQ